MRRISIDDLAEALEVTRIDILVLRLIVAVEGVGSILRQHGASGARIQSRAVGPLARIRHILRQVRLVGHRVVQHTELHFHVGRVVEALQRRRRKARASC